MINLWSSSAFDDSRLRFSANLAAFVDTRGRCDGGRGFQDVESSKDDGCQRVIFGLSLFSRPYYG